ncbi:hypothetical protein HaLaN_11533 [Haematococcus lacustris]|uniref:Uncharacterized protein n=1 Tax=Haematococcus lacustris TaxID=44745 RepID=A0A699YYF2_HAELA|nr:hypothetical protein HaLaN_11533 [Haematococcus lacustris]
MVYNKHSDNLMDGQHESSSRYATARVRSGATQQKGCPRNFALQETNRTPARSAWSLKSCRGSSSMAGPGPVAERYCNTRLAPRCLAAGEGSPRAAAR